MGACISRVKTATESLASSHPVSGSDTKRSTSRKAAKSLPKAVPDNIFEQPLRDVEHDYEIGKELGRGLYGITRLAVHRKSRVAYACKSISKRRLNPRNYTNVTREAAILRHVSSHEAIASLVDCYEDSSHVHFVLELCSGGMLYDSVTSGGHYSEQKAADIFRQMACIVAYLHAQGVMHRDLKLENFMLATPEASAPLKAIDFGLSTFFEPGQRFTEIVGSAYYVAPEVLMKDYGEECDVWSIGVILYMLLSGVPPFWDVSEAGICAQVLKGEYDLSSEPWPVVSPCVKNLIRRMLEPDASKRITIKEILEHEWVRVGGSASDRPLNAPVFVRVKQFCQMNKLKRHALHVIADCCLEEREVALIREKFSFLDVDRDGHITVDDLVKGLRSRGIPVMEEDARAMFAAADLDGSGTLNFSEYASALMVKRLDDGRIRTAFDFFDRSGRGFITIEDLRAAMSNESSEETLQQLLDLADKNKDGKVDFEQFKSMMKEGVEKEGISLKSGVALSELTESRLGELYVCKANVHGGHPR